MPKTCIAEGQWTPFFIFWGIKELCCRWSWVTSNHLKPPRVRTKIIKWYAYKNHKMVQFLSPSLSLSSTVWLPSRVSHMKVSLGLRRRTWPAVFADSPHGPGTLRAWTAYTTVTAIWLTEWPSSHRDYVITLDTSCFYDTSFSEIIIDIVAKVPGANKQMVTARVGVGSCVNCKLSGSW